MASHADLDLLDPPSLVQALRAAALHQAGALGGSSSDPDAAATRTALHAAETAVALLRAQLVADSVGGDDAPPPAKRQAVERGGGVIVAVASL